MKKQSPATTTSSVKVAVRVRPLNKREKQLGSKVIIQMNDDNTTAIENPKNGKKNIFSFDHSYWSFDQFFEGDDGVLYPQQNSRYIDQRRVFDDIGIDIINDAFKGYHTCLLAYGQTGSGKSYSVIGYGKNYGIIPLACQEIFDRLQQLKDDPDMQYSVEVSMMQIYNEVIQDLLINPKLRMKGGLLVREGTDGVYVQGLKKAPVYSYEQIHKVTELGTQNRTIGSTFMNSSSSRAHTIFTIYFKQTLFEPIERKTSHIYLVDLAGSERVAATGALGDRLREGANINKSLSVLGKVITVLAQNKKNVIVPYRQSKLTRVLSNSIGGNCKTTMIAAISPASCNYEETMSTLRYANQVKNIKNKAQVNESPREKLIRMLKEQNQNLKMQLLQLDPSNIALQMECRSHVGKCHLKNLNPDSLLTGKIRLVFSEGLNYLGGNHIILKSNLRTLQIRGIGIANNERPHCTFDCNSRTGITMALPNDQADMYQTLINGKKIHAPTRVNANDRVRFGLHNYFIYIDPEFKENQEYDWEFACDQAQPDQFFKFRKFSQMLRQNRLLKEKIDALSEELEVEDFKQNVLIGKLFQIDREWEELQKDIEREYQKKIMNAKEQDQKIYQERMKFELKELERQKYQTKRLIQMDPRQLFQLIKLKAREKFDTKLWDVLEKIPELNAICQQMGFYQFEYEAELGITSIEDFQQLNVKTGITANDPSGVKQRSIVIVKGYPDNKRKQIYRTIEYDEFVDLYYEVKARWEQFCFDETLGKSDQTMFRMSLQDQQKNVESDDEQSDSDVQNEKISSSNQSQKILKRAFDKKNNNSRNSNTVTPNILQNAWEQKIGTSMIQLGYIYNMIQQDDDQTKIFDINGKQVGTLGYSLTPVLFKKDGRIDDLAKYDSMQQAVGKKMVANIHFNNVRIQGSRTVGVYA